MPAGRPSKYDPAMCEAVREFMSRGYSRMAAAGHIGVCYDTLTNWCEVHPEFFQAVKDGQAARARFLEDGLLAAETGPQVTSRIFALKNAAPQEWSDTVRQEHTGANGGPIKSEVSASERLAEFLASRSS